MPRFRVKLTEVFYTETDTIEDAYAMWEDEAEIVEIEEVEDED